ncbi:Fur family transcriptional regulator [Aquimarina latercula]|uniref:Fur family transcriptional regulator n=1 Tax=Aquimarina latercula TaxID=987 RepID=UPI00048572FE|nr:transcriptional repressor [Aquimarina latercula]
MNKTEKILSNHVIRPTQMRSKIYRYLRRKQSAVSFSDLKKVFAEKSETNKTANRTTFYRTLKTFEDKGVVHQIDAGTGIQKYALCEPGCNCDLNQKLHLHFHCHNCDETVCLTEHKIPYINLPDGYVAEDANLVIKGICEKCSGQ